jgi:hypothetical protein
MRIAEKPGVDRSCPTKFAAESRHHFGLDL